MKKKVSFEGSAFEDFIGWSTSDRKIHQKIVKLVKEIQRSPFAGTGKPEPLKHQLSGYWSRRITDEHRLIYKITDTEIIILSCKYHYNE